VPFSNDGLIYGLPVWGVGEVGGALRFDGRTNHVNVPDHSSLDCGPSPGDDFTLDAWIKLPPGSLTSGVHVAISKQTEAGGLGYQLYFYNAQPGLQLADALGYSNLGTGVAVPKDDLWHLVAVTVDTSGGIRRAWRKEGHCSGPLGAPSSRSTSAFHGWADRNT